MWITPGPSIDLTGIFQWQTIQFDIELSVTKGAEGNILDGQTLFLEFENPIDSSRLLFLFVTATIVDNNGKPLYQHEKP